MAWFMATPLVLQGGCGRVSRDNPSLFKCKAIYDNEMKVGQVGAKQQASALSQRLDIFTMPFFAMPKRVRNEKLNGCYEQYAPRGGRILSPVSRLPSVHLLTSKALKRASICLPCCSVPVQQEYYYLNARTMERPASLSDTVVANWPYSESVKQSFLFFQLCGGR